MGSDNAILLVGPPGSGKGTHSELLCSTYPQLFHLESGALVREWVKRGSDLAKAYAPQLARGELLNDEQMFLVYLESRDRFIKEGRYDPKSQWMLADGYPRTLGQAQANDRLRVRGIIELQVGDPETLVQRIQNDPKRAHRTDNDRDTILNRIKVYEVQTPPMLEFYRSRGVPVTSINAEVYLTTVAMDVLNAMGEFLYSAYQDASLTSSQNRA